MSRKGFQPGHTGRPRGTRNKLAGRVFEDIFAHWCEPIVPGSNVCKGQEALQALHARSPGEYLRLTASVLPKEFVFENAVTELEDDQVDELILKLRQRMLEARAAPPTLLASPVEIEIGDEPEPRH
jgi:hypothetical protein